MLGLTEKSPSSLSLTGAFALMALLGGSWFARPARIGAQSPPATGWTVRILLPPRVVAGHRATLAVLGRDGRLAPDVTVEVGGDRVKTDETGRAFFTAPNSGQILFARAAGTVAAAVIDPSAAANNQLLLSVAQVVSVREPFRSTAPVSAERQTQSTSG
jgi:hypothetical protein